MKNKLLRSEAFCKWVIIYSTIIYIYSTDTKTNALSAISVCFSMFFKESFFPRCSEEGEFSAWANMPRNLLERLPKHKK